MYKKYLQLKKQYPSHLIIIRNGIFYKVYNEDCYIIEHIVYYNINVFNNYINIGFPIKSLYKIKHELNEINISYIIVNDEIIEYSSITNHYNGMINLLKKSRKDFLIALITEQLLDMNTLDIELKRYK